MDNHEINDGPIRGLFHAKDESGIINGHINHPKIKELLRYGEIRGTGGFVDQFDAETWGLILQTTAPFDGNTCYNVFYRKKS